MDHYTSFITSKINQISKRSIITSVVVISLLILIIAIIILVVNYVIVSKYHFPDTVTVDNYQSLPVNLPDDVKKNLSAQLYYLLDEHFEISNHRSNSIVSSIRSNTYQNQSDSTINRAAFIVDTDAYQQSYNVTVAWSDQEVVPQPISIECTPSNQSKYPDSICYGMFYDSSSPELYFPKEFQLSSGEHVTAIYNDKDKYGVNHILINIQGCDTEAIKNQAQKLVQEYLDSSSNLNSKQFVYQKNIDQRYCNEKRS